MLIKNCIFDLGAVILNIDVTLTVKAFEELLPHQAENVRTNVLKSSVFLEFEKGLIDEQTFRNGIRDLFSSDLTDNQIDTAWNALLLDYPIQRIELLKNVKNQYRTFLLSNTNSIHQQAFEKILEETHQIPKLDMLFERAYYSQDLKKRKPDVEIYHHVLRENGLAPEETVFFDDNLDNILAARSIHIQAIHIQPNQNEVTEYFKTDEKGIFILDLEKLVL